jgi:phospholipid/cholesterol/gamma-HCH transport system substrate-binding protein
LESKTNYTVVGLVVLILVAGLFSGMIWLSTGFDTKKYDLYTVYVGEAVSGLSDDSVVKYNGVKVGFVNSIELNKFDPQEVKIQIKIEEGTPVTTSTHATLINQGITGTVYLGLSASSPSPFPLQKTPGEPYPVIPYKASFLSQLETSINDVSIGIKRIFDKENALAFKKSLTNLQSITDAIASNSDSLNHSLKELPALISDLKTNINKFGTMAEHMSTAGKQVSVTMKAGRSTIDKISQQALPPMVLLLQRMDLIGANLEKVSEQMRQNPAVVIRGNTPPKSGPGE